MISAIGRNMAMNYSAASRHTNKDSIAVHGNVDWCRHCWKQYGVPSTAKNTAIWSINPTPMHIAGQNFNSKPYMHPYVQ